MSGLLKTSGAATADADRGRGGRVGACGFTTAGTLMFNLRRRNRFRKARLNCSYVSDGDAGDIVRRPVIDSTWRRGLILTCSGHYVTLVGPCPRRMQNRAHRDFVRQKRRKKVRERWSMVKCNSKGKSKGKEGSAACLRRGQERQVQLKTSFQFVSRSNECGPDMFDFVLQHPAGSQKLSRTILAPIDESRGNLESASYWLPH